MHKRIFIVLFFVIICLPSIAMFFYKTDINVEKRTVQRFPEMQKDGKINIEFFDELDNYFSDNFAFRQELIMADSVLKSSVFLESNNDKVIVGKDGWLFFSESLDDYFGRNTLTDREVFSCARVLYLLQENAVSKGKQFLFTVEPNKNSLYSQYMPERYIKISDKNNYSMLKVELSKQKVNTVDLHQLFQNEGKEVYHKLDTHWNNEGAALACGWMLENLGKNHYDYSKESGRIQKDFSGDLYEMLFPRGTKKDENVIYEKEHSYEIVSKNKDVEDISLETETKGKENSIVLYRDSFGNALIPFVADEYGHGYFTKAVPYNWELADTYHADTVVIELVERHIPSLIEEVPYMAAPIRDEVSDVEVVSDCRSSIEMFESEEEYIPLGGEIDKNYISDDGKIFVRLSNDERQYTFEAFPASFLGGNKDGYGYGMYLDTSVCEAGTYEIEVITEKDNKFYTLGSQLELESEE